MQNLKFKNFNVYEEYLMCVVSALMKKLSGRHLNVTNDVASCSNDMTYRISQNSEV